MNREIKCEDDRNSLSREERKQKKEERRKKKKEKLKDKQNSADVEQACDHAVQNTSPEVLSKSSKKKRKMKKQHNSNSVCDETVCERKKGNHSINGDGKIKRQKTDNIEQTTSCDASLEEIKSKKKKRKKEKTIPKDPSFDSNQLSGVSQDIGKSSKKKNKKSKGEVPDGDVMAAKIDSTLHEMDCGSNHEMTNKKQHYKVHLKHEETDDTKHTDSKENLSSPAKKESSKKKKKKKHSKHKDGETVDETDNIPRKKHKKKSKSSSCIGGSDKDVTDDGCVETQDVKHVTSDANISNTGDEKRSKHHKNKKNHSKNSATALDMVKNMNGKQEICSDVTKPGKTSSEQMVTSVQSPDCAAVAHGNWQGNLFESSERQNKFLRLLGGMKKSNNDTAGTGKGSAILAGTKKKGLFGSLASSKTASGGSGVALDVNAAASLNRKLEDEYNKAMNFKLSGKVGSGFGFAADPAEGKKFHIDVNKSKSIKFDDD
ncbi:hypothetical protein BsWGS_04658 [Bradybaena similaris]